MIFNMSWSLDLFFNRSATQKNQMIMRFYLGLDITFLLPFFIEFTIVKHVKLHMRDLSPLSKDKTVISFLTFSSQTA